jgi:two-component system, sensor histidine kinase
VKTESIVDVVVIDANAHLADLLAARLTACNSTALPFYSGSDGLHAVKGLRPKVVITEIMLDDMSGFEVLRAVRRVDSDYRPWMASMTKFDGAYFDQVDQDAKFDYEFFKPLSVQAFAILLKLVGNSVVNGRATAPLMN